MTNRPWEQIRYRFQSKQNYLSTSRNVFLRRRYLETKNIAVLPASYHKQIVVRIEIIQEFLFVIVQLVVVFFEEESLVKLIERDIVFDPEEQLIEAAGRGVLKMDVGLVPVEDGQTKPAEVRLAFPAGHFIAAFGFLATEQNFKFENCLKLGFPA